MSHLFHIQCKFIKISEERCFWTGTLENSFFKQQGPDPLPVIWQWRQKALANTEPRCLQLCCVNHLCLPNYKTLVNNHSPAQLMVCFFIWARVFPQWPWLKCTAAWWGSLVHHFLNRWINDAEVHLKDWRDSVNNPALSSTDRQRSTLLQG